MAWWCWARARGPRPHRYRRAGEGSGRGRAVAAVLTVPSLPRRLTVLLEPRQGFRRARPRPEEPPPAATAAEGRPGPPAPRRSLCPPAPTPRAGRPSPRRLVRPLLFAVGVSGNPGRAGTPAVSAARSL